MAGKIFMVEMTVSNVELLKLPSETCDHLETCVLLRLFENIEMEICDCDMDVDLDNPDEVSKGASCIFSLPNDADLTATNVSINVFKKDTQDQRIFIGKYDLHLQEIFEKLMKGQDAPKKSTEDINLIASSLLKELATIPESLQSLKSVSIKTNQSASDPTTETIKGLFPLFNHDDDNIGFIILTLRLTCYGNVITQPRIIKKDPVHIVLGQKSSQTESQPDMYQVCSYQKSKNNWDSSTSIPCPCHGPGRDEDQLSTKQSNDCCARPSPVQSCTCAPKDLYDEYVQEINGNSLVIRIAKGTRLRAELIEPGNEGNANSIKDVIKYSRNKENTTIQIPHEQKTKPIINGLRCTCSDQDLVPNCNCPMLKRFKCPNHCSKLPIIKGNLKYPNKIEELRVGNPKERNICMQTNDCEIKKAVNMNQLKNAASGPDGQCPKGIEICHKGDSDPNTDVYVLKLGKRKPGGGKVEVELRTPKCPDLEPKPTVTTAMQVYEEEFEDYKVKEVGKKSVDSTAGNENGKEAKKGKKEKKGKGKKKK